MKTTVILFFISIFFFSCIGDDFIDDRVDPILRITNPIDSIALDSTYQFQISFLNYVGKEEEVEAEWTSSDETIIQVDQMGLASAKSPGSAEITAEYTDLEGTLVTDSRTVGVGERTVKEQTKGKKGLVSTTSTYKLTGEFTLTSNDDGSIELAFFDDYEASTALPGLYVYLTNNPSTISGALEIQAVEVFEGAHTYTIENVELEQYGYVLYFCKPFNVKVGHGEIEDQ
ncbi:Ig-like domain-containing protein [Portibacter marinus]|uniref:Ig-like domain-containing protein n=1 Tax=Portibacter marinus TaxID=2898660 RepID=UPI001F475E2F|nr:Ig-like domain-containing protein [Portibacter marinus]